MDPIRPRALCDAIADLIRERLLDREWQPGEELDEAAFTKDYGVSRTPVREALKLLNHEGLLTAHARRGMTVTVVPAQELAQALELRRLLQAHADACHPESADLPSASLVGRLLELVERRIRLATAGPANGSSAPLRRARSAGCRDAPAR